MSENASNHLNILRGVKLDISIVLGTTDIPIKEILTLDKGMTLELDRDKDDLADIYINDRLFAKGELLSVDNEYAIKIITILEPFQQDDYLEKYTNF